MESNKKKGRPVKPRDDRRQTPAPGASAYDRIHARLAQVETSESGDRPRWFQLSQQRLLKSELSEEGRRVLLLKGTRAKTYGWDRVYAVKYEKFKAGFRGPVYVWQTHDKLQATRIFDRCLHDDVP